MSKNNVDFDFQTRRETQAPVNKYSSFFKIAANTFSKINYFKGAIGISMIVLSLAAYNIGSDVLTTRYADERKEQLEQTKKAEQADAANRKANIDFIKKATPEDLAKVLSHIQNQQAYLDTEIDKANFMLEFLYDDGNFGAEITSGYRNENAKELNEHQSRLQSNLAKESEVVNDIYKKIITGYDDAVNSADLSSVNSWFNKAVLGKMTMDKDLAETITQIKTKITDTNAFEKKYQAHISVKNSLRMK